MTISEFVRQHRKQYKMTQQELAFGQRLGVVPNREEQ